MRIRRVPCISAVLLIGSSAIAQSSNGFSLGQQVVTKSVNGVKCIYAVDLDGDGDADVLSASANDDKIAWYENLGPRRPGRFGEQQVLTGPAGSATSANGANSVYAVDLDGDGDADVLSASGSDHKIAWYENLTVNRGGSASAGKFGAQQVITTSANIAHSVYATDLDGDGDADVLSASWKDNKVAWYENLGPASPGTFGLPQVLSGPLGSATSAYQAMSVYAADLDGDGDADVLSASRGDDKIAWYPNLTVTRIGPASPGKFGPQEIITTSAYGARSVHALDLDGDGDVDVLSASRGDDKIAWYENLGPASPGSFGAQQVITANAVGAASVYAMDLDGDGDADVVSGGAPTGWYENLGPASPGSFGPQQVLDDRAVSVYATDLDGDGGADVLSSSWTGIAWRRQSLVVRGSRFGQFR